MLGKSGSWLLILLVFFFPRICSKISEKPIQSHIFHLFCYMIECRNGLKVTSLLVNFMGVFPRDSSKFWFSAMHVLPLFEYNFFPQFVRSFCPSEQMPSNSDNRGDIFSLSFRFSALAFGPVVTTLVLLHNYVLWFFLSYMWGGKGEWLLKTRIERWQKENPGG